MVRDCMTKGKPAERKVQEVVPDRICSYKKPFVSQEQLGLT